MARSHAQRYGWPHHDTIYVSVAVRVLRRSGDTRLGVHVYGIRIVNTAEGRSRACESETGSLFPFYKYWGRKVTLSIHALAIFRRLHEDA